MKNNEHVIGDFVYYTDSEFSLSSGIIKDIPSKFEKMEFDIFITDASGELVWSTTYCEDQKLYNEFKSNFK